MWAESRCQQILGMVPLNRQATLKGTYSPDGKIAEWLVQVKSTTGEQLLVRLADWKENAQQSVKEGKYPMMALVFHGHPSILCLMDHHQWLWAKNRMAYLEHLLAASGVDTHEK